MPMGIGLGIGVTRGGGVGWWPAGSELALEFDNQRGFNSIDRTKTTPDSILTYTNPSPKLVYGSDGVLGYANHNVLLYSQTLNSWIKSAVIVESDAAVAPDGTMTADKVVATNTASVGRFLYQSVTAATESSTFSIYAKAAEYDLVRVIELGSYFYYATFNLTTATITRTGGTKYVSSSMEAVGNGWYRLTIVTTASTGPPSVVGFPSSIDPTNNPAAYAGDGVSGTYFWGGQYRAGGVAGTYIPTTTAAVYSLPIDHNPTTFEPLGVLIEEQRTNLLLRSQEFNNTGSWVVPAGATIAADNITAPDGTLTADKLTRAATSGVALGYGNMGNGLALTAGVHTLSYFAKADTQTSFTVALVTGGKALGSEVVFNLSAGTAGAITNYGATTGSVATIQELNGGWYRCSLTVTVTTATWFMQAEMPSAGAYWLWGAQLEAGAFPTSYIPTVASQVTRAADQVSILTSAFAYNATASTMVAAGDFGSQPSGVNYLLASLGNGTANDRFTLCGAANGTTQAQATVVTGGSFVANFTLMGVIAINAEVRVALAAQANNFAGVGNGGAALQTDVTGAMPAAATTLYIGGSHAPPEVLNGHIKRLTYFPTRRTDADLQVLST